MCELQYKLGSGGTKFRRERGGGGREMGNEEKRRGGQVWGGVTLERADCSRLCHLYGSK